MNDGPNEKNVFMLEKSNRENNCCRMKCGHEYIDDG